MEDPARNEDEELELAMELSRAEFEASEQERVRMEEAILESQAAERLRRANSESLNDLKRLSVAPPPSPFLGMRTSHGNRNDALRASYVPPSAPRLESLNDGPSAPPLEDLYTFDVNGPFGGAPPVFFASQQAMEAPVVVAAAAAAVVAPPLPQQPPPARQGARQGRPHHEVALMGAERRFGHVASGTVYLCLVGFEGRELRELISDPSSQFTVSVTWDGQTVACKEVKNINALYLELYLTVASFARQGSPVQVTWSYHLTGLAKAFSANRPRSGSVSIDFDLLVRSRNGVRDFPSADGESSLSMRFAVGECEVPEGPLMPL
jgi:hypothetical protein